MTDEDREQFILDNQWAFKHGAMIEFGERDSHIDQDGEIISKKTIEDSIDDPENEAYRITLDGKNVGGAVLKINKDPPHNHLELFFVLPDEHGKGIGYAAWQAIEACHPETEVWETCTPYFEKQNIHFYDNKCGFHITEFWCEYNVDPNEPNEDRHPDEGPDEMFRFVKVMK